MPAAETIRSRSNPLVKKLRDIRDGRETRAELFVEGLKIAEELLSSTVKPLRFFRTAALEKSAKAQETLRKLRERKVPETVMVDEVMDFVSDTQSPPGLIILAERPRWDLETLLMPSNPLFVILDGMQLPSNAGAVMRAAEAAGATGLISIAGTCDLYGPKALRASAGSAFRLRMIPSLDRNEVFDACRKSNVAIVTADSNGGISFRKWDWKKGTALLLGAEGPGLAGTALTPAMTPIHIPMKDPVESLNVSVAAGIILFEAHHQREGSA